jgi:Ni/Co efflux regulator RcnB
MKRLLIGILAASSLAAALPASAAAWQSINSRQNQIFAKIETGVRNGALTRNEAASIKNQFYGIARLEASYRASRPGLTVREQQDLVKRLNALNLRIHIQRHDAQRR